jgi:hypothetical protein
MPVRSRRGSFPVEWGHAARSMRKKGWVGTPLPDEMHSLGYPHNGKVVGHWRKRLC